MNSHHKKELFESRDEGDKSPPGNKLQLLPLDMEVEILTRLPVKSLMKFLCVSKTWSSLIRSQTFAASYYARSYETRSRFRVFVHGGAQRLLIFSGEEETFSSSLDANLDMTVPSVTLALGGSKCTSVHGFFGCCHASNFTICNPSTGQIITFPCKGPYTSLGYDPVDDQFKALTLVPALYSNPSFIVHEVITLGGRGGRGVVSRSNVTSPTYCPMTKGLNINGFMYFGAWAPSHRTTPVFVCFDVRYERILSFITTPKDVLVCEAFSILIEYKGKLAVIVPRPSGDPCFDCFDLWILEDVTKHEWSKQTFELPLSLPFSPAAGERLISQGTNKAGDIVFSPTTLPGRAQPFYVFYFNPDTKNIRRVRIHGVADTEEFWSRYGLTGICRASFSPQHADSIASL